MGEPLTQHYEFMATSTLTRTQLEVFTLFQMVGVNISNEKFQALWKLVSLNVPTSYIVDLPDGWSQYQQREVSGTLEVGVIECSNIIHSGSSRWLESISATRSFRHSGSWCH